MYSLIAMTRRRRAASDVLAQGYVSLRRSGGKAAGTVRTCDLLQTPLEVHAPIGRRLLTTATLLYLEKNKQTLEISLRRWVQI